MQQGSWRIISHCITWLAVLVRGTMLIRFGSTHVPLEELNTYLAKAENKGIVDVVEIFGGESGVGKLCLRRRLRRGGG